MPGVILAYLDRPAAAPGLLRAAAHLADLVGGAEIHALIVRTPPEATVIPSEEVLTPQQADRIRAQQEARAVALTAAFEDWRPQADHPAHLADVEAIAEDIVAQRGAAADFVVIGQPRRHPHGTDLPVIRAALAATDRPILLVPPGATAPFGRSVAIAWRDDGRAVKAVLPALRLLSGAAQVHVLQGVREGSDDLPVPAVFLDHGIAAQMHVLPIGDGVFARALLDKAHSLGADLLVMGAYGHNPLREMIFGGVTRFMLDHADLPVLMRH
ncbi:MAG TPA: universal stress protein [Acetobacteraceae bacterium]|nr:universal stress protein [Acetobacteraceae bacterium]